MVRISHYIRAMVVGAAMVAAAAPAASAQINGIVFSGTTGFCFGAGCSSFSNNVTFNGATLTGSGVNNSLINTYAPGSFSATTDFDGFASVSGSTNNNFGRIRFTNDTRSYNNVVRLQVTFSSPGSPVPLAQIWTGLLSGSIAGGSTTSSLSLVFSSVITSPESFNNGPVYGMFSETVGNYSVTAGNSLSTNNGRLSATFQVQEETVSTVPEPASMILLGTGMLGVFGAAVRRRRNARS